MSENHELCAECGGKCCKSMPGVVFPEEFIGGDGSFNKEELYKLLKSGMWAIDWWEGDPRGDKDELSRAFYVRPATKNRIGVLLDASWGGECCLLTDAGCSLSYEDRPLECSGLKAMPNGECVPSESWSKKNAAIAWIEYRDLIEDIIDELEEY